MRFFLIILATLFIHTYAMEEQSPQEKILCPVSLQQLCINRLTGLLSEPPNSTLRKHLSFKKLFELNKLQQSNARWLENNMLKHLLKRLKENIVIHYKDSLEGSPWYSVKPEIQTQNFCIDDASHLCDYSSKQKLVATIHKNQTLLLLLENIHGKDTIPTLQSVVNVKEFSPLTSLKFSPEGLFIALTYLNNNKKKSLALLNTKLAIDNNDECLLPIPLKDKNLARALFFTFDDRFAVSHSSNLIDVFDLKCPEGEPQNALKKVSSIKRTYRCIAMNPSMHRFAALDSKGSIDVYAMSDIGKLSFVGTIRCAPQHVKMHWLACGATILIQDRQTNILWDPVYDIKVNTLGRLPYIVSNQVAHSPCKKYIAYRTLKGVCILNLKTQEWSRIEHYYPEYIHFNENSSLIGILNSSQLVEHTSYEYTTMPLDQLIIYCLLAKHVLKTSYQLNSRSEAKESPHKPTLASLIRNANSLTAQQGFSTLPMSIREHVFTQLYQTLQVAARKQDANSIIVVHLNDRFRAFVLESPHEKK